MQTKIKDRIISPSASLLDAMKQMDEVKVKILLVFSGEHFEGLIIKTAYSLKSLITEGSCGRKWVRLEARG